MTKTKGKFTNNRNKNKRTLIDGETSLHVQAMADETEWHLWREREKQIDAKRAMTKAEREKGKESEGKRERKWEREREREKHGDRRLFQRAERKQITSAILNVRMGREWVNNEMTINSTLCKYMCIRMYM